MKMFGMIACAAAVMSTAGTAQAGDVTAQAGEWFRLWSDRTQAVAIDRSSLETVGRSKVVRTLTTRHMLEIETGTDFRIVQVSYNCQSETMTPISMAVFDYFGSGQTADFTPATESAIPPDGLGAAVFNIVCRSGFPEGYRSYDTANAFVSAYRAWAREQGDAPAASD